MDDFFKDQEKTNYKFEDSLFDLSEDSKDFLKKLQTLKKDMSQKDDEIEELFDKFKEIEGIYETQGNFNTLQTRFNVFTEIENIDMITNVFMPKIIDFTKRIDEFILSHESMKQCIRKFDEDISIKANSIKVDLLRQEIEDGFMSNKEWGKIDQKLG